MERAEELENSRAIENPSSTRATLLQKLCTLRTMSSVTYNSGEEKGKSSADNGLEPRNKDSMKSLFKRGALTLFSPKFAFSYQPHHAIYQRRATLLLRLCQHSAENRLESQIK